MELSTTSGAYPQTARPRLVEIEADLGIAGAQAGAWEVFVETFEMIAGVLEKLDAEVAGQFADRAPSLPNAVELHLRSLSARLEAARLLKAITESLYRSLSPRQRERADRLLPPVCGLLACTGRPAR